MLGEIGEVLLDVNLKSSADNWIGYINISQKYLNFFDNNLDIQRPIRFLTNEILNTLNKISVLVNCVICIIFLLIKKKFLIVQDADDVKTKTHLIKVLSFLVKVINRLTEIFTSHIIYEDMLIFLVHLFK